MGGGGSSLIEGDRWEGGGALIEGDRGGGGGGGTYRRVLPMH